MNQQEFDVWLAELREKKEQKAVEGKEKYKCILCDGTGKYKDRGCSLCNGTGIDTEDKDYAVCPHCGYENEVDEVPNDETEWSCGNCDKSFTLIPAFSVTYTTKRVNNA